MAVKRVIETYEDYLAAIEAKKSEDAVTRNEAKNALGNFRRRDPERFKLYTLWNEGIEEFKPIVSKPKDNTSEPKKVQRKNYSKEAYIRKHPNIDIEELRQKARERLVEFPYGFEITALSWITTEDFLKSIDQLALTDLITGSGRLSNRETLRRNCIKYAVADGRIDEKKLRQTILNRCRKLWDEISNPPDYSFNSVKRFILQVASAEELADADRNYTKLFGVIFDRRIKKLDVDEIRENELNDEVHTNE